MSGLGRALSACGIAEGETFSVAAIKDGAFRGECFVTVEAAEAFLAGYSGWNWYVAGNPMKPGTTGKPSASDVLEARVLLLDADPTGGLDGTTCREVILEIRAWLSEQGVDATAIDSGRGAQLWIRTDPGLDRRRASRGLAARFGRQGIKFDSTFNLDRLHRLPGSLNLKTNREASFLP